MCYNRTETQHKAYKQKQKQKTGKRNRNPTIEHTKKEFKKKHLAITCLNQI